MFLFKNITGKKEGKVYTEPVVKVCPTPGEFRLTPVAQKVLDLQDGDFALISVHPEDNSRVFLAKGITGVPVRDENGVIQKDGRGRTVYEENTGFGAVVRIASEGSSDLKLTGAAGWNAIGGDIGFNKLYTLGEGMEAGIPTGKDDEKGDPEIHVTMFYELIFKEQKVKSARKGKDGDDEDDEDDTPTTQELENGLEGMVQEEI